MKRPDRETVSRLEELPNIGKAMASYLRSIGIDKPRDLIGKDPFALYDQLCIKKKKQIDPCVIDVFMAVVDFMDRGESEPWWSFTSKRKEMIQEQNTL